jgi:membrane protease YdiL (CAAX protease family)
MALKVFLIVGIILIVGGFLLSDQGFSVGSYEITNTGYALLAVGAVIVGILTIYGVVLLVKSRRERSSRRRIIGFILFLIVGIILIVVGVLLYRLGPMFQNMGLTSNQLINVSIAIFGGVIVGLDVTVGIYLLVKSRYKE